MTLDYRLPSARGFGREHAQVAHEQRAATERLRNVPSVWREPVDAIYVLEIGDGNIIQTISGVNFYGLAYDAGAPDIISEVPTAVPSQTTGGNPDGLSWATLFPETGTPTLVWVAHAIQLTGWASPQGPFLPTILPKDAVVQCLAPVPVPVTGSPSTLVPVFIPWLL